jgi:hypothetical protein
MKKLTILFIFLSLITLKADIIPPGGGSGSGSSGGDMYKSVYDTNNNSVVDNSEKITGLNFPSISGNSGKYLKTDGTQLLWDTPAGGGGGTPGGNNKTIQYNNNGVFAGDDNLTWDSGLQQLSITSPNSAIKINAVPAILDFKNRTGTDEAIDQCSEAFKFVPNANTSSFIIVVRFKNTDTEFDANISLKLYSDSYGIPDQYLATSSSNVIPKNTGYAEYSFTFNYSISAYTTYWIVVDNPYLPSGILYWDRNNSGNCEYAYYGWIGWEIEDGKGVWYKFGVYQTKAFNIDEKATIELKSGNPILIGSSNSQSIRQLVVGSDLYNSFGIKVYPNNRTWLHPNTGDIAIGFVPGINSNIFYIGKKGTIKSDGTYDETWAYSNFWKVESGNYCMLVNYWQGQEKIRLGHSQGRGFKISGINYIFPSSQGVSNSVLTNDGNGNLSWTIPVGGSNKSAISTISAGSSPFTYQQTSYNLASVIVSGGAVTSIEISRNGNNWYNTGLTQGQFTLNKNDYIRITYTTAPNMYLMEH